jgi:F-type H+-transporting ATPase subunit b
MLDIYPLWLFVQFATIVFLFLFLNYYLFQPFLRLFKEREDNTQGALDKAKELDQQKDTLLADIDEKLNAARSTARSNFEEASNEGLEIQKKALEEAQAEAMEINKKAKADLETAADQARTALRSNVEAFSKQIVEKLVGA